MSKRIGLVAWPTGSNSFGSTNAYIIFFSKFGIVELIMPNETTTRNLDLMVIPGGPDVDTSRYLDALEPLDLTVSKPCPFRERFDRVLLPQYIENGTPIFGICRGHQTLNVHFGGRLIQDMYHETNGEDRTKKVHNLYVEHYANQIPGVRNNNFEVNSLHHQVIEEAFLPSIARVLARHTNKSGTTRNGLVESVTYWPTLPIHSVQWHPEEIEDAFSVSLIEHLLSITRTPAAEAPAIAEAEDNNQ